ncbi:MAG: DUF1688 family protein [Rubrivivax sp.]|nr:DUF1688 family protein [Rubrivivax sp.]
MTHPLVSDPAAAGAEDSGPPRDPIGPLWQPATIRARCAAVAQAVEDGRSGWFSIDRAALPALAQQVADLIRQRFPDLQVPLHSRWRHFQAGGVDRAAELEAALASREPLDAARARIDLTIVSVLLDAGAGADWHYEEGRGGAAAALALPAHRQGRDALLALLDQASGTSAAPVPAPAPSAAAEGAAEEPAETPEPTPTQSPAQTATAATAVTAAAPLKRYARSEGLAVASFRAFMDGTFSNRAEDPLRVDARVLTRLDAAALRAVFQAGPSNAMPGLEGRAELLRRLGAVLEEQAGGGTRTARPSQLLEPWLSSGEPVDAAELLARLAHEWAPIWLHGSRVLGLPGGDVWRHLWAGSASPEGPHAPTGGWVPFHKLSQWLVYSLAEPLQAAGVALTGLDQLTGLPEYRNGGLLIDGGVIVPRDPRDLARTWKAGDELVVEWRALTVHLLDELAAEVRRELGLTPAQLPLAAVLEGGTWLAGRAMAQRLRGGQPPLRIDSDGTVF